MTERSRKKTRAGLVALMAAALGSTGCASLVSSAASGFADNLSTAVLNQTDPETVRDGAPAYLLLLDSLVEGNPDDPAVLQAAAELYASYGAVFADDPERARRLTERARSYGERSLCLEYRPACAWDEQDYDAFEETLDGLRPGDADALYSYALSSLAYIRAHSDDWNSLAELPRMEAVLERLLTLNRGEYDAQLYTYLGILATLRPPSLGGEPELARNYFERAIELTGGRDLSVKVEYARGYARLLYERDLHDRLLNEVLEADPVVPGYTLTNTLAQRDAEVLLESADAYF
ncbi:TRAP transporter TatT component family protein [Lentisalinibacter orientalis]|uniref:TRAP transporter TatT component family protein n=1 Tax=Lentisalinibacter orientalis TaxID=2992241 RepID=UPI003866D37E